MVKLLSIITAILIGSAVADSPATPTDLNYIFGPLEIVDAEDTDEEEPEPYVFIEVVKPRGVIRLGDEVTLRCVVIGMDNTPYVIRWQYCEDLDGKAYHDIDCRDSEYTFTATEENVGYYYRVLVTCVTEG